MDHKRLRQAKTIFGTDYFRELLERSRSIRTSERRIWQQITDIYAECSIDYDPQADVTKEFFYDGAEPFHYAIIGQTAPEIIYTHTDHNQDNLGLILGKSSIIPKN